MAALPTAFWYLWAGALVNRLGGFVRPFLMLYLTKQRGFSTAEAGVVVALYGAGSFASGPLGGYLADRVGRRRTMLLSFVLGPAMMVLLARAPAGGLVGPLALLLGLASDLYRPAQHAAVADLVPPSERTRAFAYIYWAVNLGFSAAAVVAGMLATRDFIPLFYADAATTLLFGLIVYLRVPESQPARDDLGRTPPSLLAALRDGPFMVFLFAQLLVSVVFTQSETTLALEMRSHGVTPAIYGRLLALNGLLVVLLQPLFTRVLDRFRRGRLLAVASLLSGTGFFLTAFGHDPAWYAFTVVVWTAAELLYSPIVPVVVTDLAPTALRGSYQGVYLASWGLASSLGPLLGGAALHYGGSRVLWGGALALSALSALLHLAIAPARRRRLMATEETRAALAREEGRSEGEAEAKRSATA